MFYDPTTQRFLSEDPIGFDSGDFNFYRYVGNNSVNKIDPSGLDWLEKISDLWDAGGYDSYRAGYPLREQAENAAINFLKKYNLPKTSIHNGFADAYRHCVWSCLMTSEFGAEDAKEIGDNHEAAGNRRGQPKAEEEMDKWNNQIGRKCGINKGSETCQSKCEKQALAGNLKVIHR